MKLKSTNSLKDKYQQLVFRFLAAVILNATSQSMQHSCVSFSKTLGVLQANSQQAM
jgi:hypothetical protein